MLSDLIAACALEYGDPPNIECCAAGPSMSSVPRRVLEYWVKPVARGEGVERHPKLGVMVVKELTATEFIRDPAYEIDITPDWAL